MRNSSSLNSRDSEWRCLTKPGSNLFRKLGFVVTILLAALMIGILALPANAQQFPSGQTGPPMERVQRGQMIHPDTKDVRQQKMMDRLGVSAEQAERLKFIREQHMAQGHAIQQQIRTKRLSLMEYLSAPDATEARARAMQQEVRDLETQMNNLRIKAWFEMRKNLSSEQLQKLSQMRQQFQQRRGGRMGQPGGEPVGATSFQGRPNVRMGQPGQANGGFPIRRPRPGGAPNQNTSGFGY